MRQILLFVGFLLAGNFVTAEEVEQTTKEQLLAKVPNFFSWEYTFTPEPGKRIWLRVDDKTFIERYPSGKENRFLIIGRISVENTTGTLVQIQGGKLQAFVPDKDSEPRYLKMRADANANWGHMGELNKVE